MLQPDDIAEAIAWRHHFHRYPETAFEERETSRFIAERLGSWGLQVRTGYAGTGVVGSLSRGTSARSIAIRADIDALPIIEATGLPHASRNPGKMHACGHDGHTAMLLAAAKQCQCLDFDGTVHFIFQPAEESEGGARRMIEDGLFRDIGTAAVFALHNWPRLAVGRCVARDGVMMAAFAVFEIEVRGRGGHAAMPHESIDPIVAAAQIVTALQTITNRSVSPLDAAVVSVTQVLGGHAWNVIPETCTLRGTARWFSDANGQLIERRVTSIARQVAAAFECEAHVDFQWRYPATINDPREAAFVREVVRTNGLEIADEPPSMGAEDFAFMLREKPGCYLWLGARREGDNPGIHSPRYDFNDLILPTGAGIWLALIAQALGSVASPHRREDTIRTNPL